ncbi:hypothetical protein PG994_005976 [Apiospora phragmitis]|uniref:Uncharacterized protein n=1 Tax=Apiospora phragmitis TaxID=2905665 RepID=A0ABR1VDS1_9PEZI
MDTSSAAMQAIYELKCRRNSAAPIRASTAGKGAPMGKKKPENINNPVKRKSIDDAQLAEKGQTSSYSGQSHHSYKQQQQQQQQRQQRQPPAAVSAPHRHRQPKRTAPHGVMKNPGPSRRHKESDSAFSENRPAEISSHPNHGGSNDSTSPPLSYESPLLPEIGTTSWTRPSWSVTKPEALDRRSSAGASSTGPPRRTDYHIPPTHILHGATIGPDVPSAVSSSQPIAHQICPPRPQRARGLNTALPSAFAAPPGNKAATNYFADAYPYSATTTCDDGDTYKSFEKGRYHSRSNGTIRKGLYRDPLAEMSSFTNQGVFSHADEDVFNLLDEQHAAPDDVKANPTSMRGATASDTSRICPRPGWKVEPDRVNPATLCAVRIDKATSTHASASDSSGMNDPMRSSPVATYPQRSSHGEEEEEEEVSSIGLGITAPTTFSVEHRRPHAFSPEDFDRYLHNLSTNDLIALSTKAQCELQERGQSFSSILGGVHGSSGSHGAAEADAASAQDGGKVIWTGRLPDKEKRKYDDADSDMEEHGGAATTKPEQRQGDEQKNKKQKSEQAAASDNDTSATTHSASALKYSPSRLLDLRRPTQSQQHEAAVSKKTGDQQEHRQEITFKTEPKPAIVMATADAFAAKQRLVEQALARKAEDMDWHYVKEDCWWSPQLCCGGAFELIDKP